MKHLNFFILLFIVYLAVPTTFLFGDGESLLLDNEITRMQFSTVLYRVDAYKEGRPLEGAPYGQWGVDWAQDNELIRDLQLRKDYVTKSEAKRVLYQICNDEKPYFLTIQVDPYEKGPATRKEVDEQAIESLKIK